MEYASWVYNFLTGVWEYIEFGTGKILKTSTTAPDGLIAQGVGYAPSIQVKTTTGKTFRTIGFKKNGIFSILTKGLSLLGFFGGKSGRPTTFGGGLSDPLWSFRDSGDFSDKVDLKPTIIEDDLDKILIDRDLKDTEYLQPQDGGASPVVGWSGFVLAGVVIVLVIKMVSRRK